MKPCEEGGPGLIPLWVRICYRGDVPFVSLPKLASKNALSVSLYGIGGELEAVFSSVGKAIKATGYSRVAIMSGHPEAGKRTIIGSPVDDE